MIDFHTANHAAIFNSAADFVALGFR
jgi:hypothetical protein